MNSIYLVVLFSSVFLSARFFPPATVASGAIRLHGFLWDRMVATGAVLPLTLPTTNIFIWAPLTAGFTRADDGGASWQRLAKLAKTDDLLLDNIVVDAADPKTLLVGAWVVDHPGWRSVYQPRCRQNVDHCRGNERSIDTCAHASSVGCRRSWIAGTLQRCISQRRQWSALDPDHPRRGAWIFTRWSRSPSIPRIHERSTRVPGTYRGRPRTAARIGTISSRG